MNPTTIRRLSADIALALPFAVVVFVVLAAATRNTGVAVGGIAAVIAVQVALHRLAVRAARRLHSPALPWWLWATVTISAWVAVAGLASIAAHMSNVQVGVDDSFLIVPAIIAGAVGIAAAIASVVLSGRIGIALLRERRATGDAISH
ncbi:hypothetical protein ACPPVW_16585 [Leifsonia sp. McL0607]|uniref:hypothetical protein n=1 Tax=Leifsonia sp. McL0607 TaxID=3415672 RepID=UPI003CED3239